MKKLLMGLCIIGLGTAASAQSFYVQGGANFANITKNNAGETSDNNVLTTFNVGGMVRFGIASVFDLETGLLFTGKGAKTEVYLSNSTDDNYYKAKFNPYYIELPLNAVIKFPTTGNSNIFISAGPYVAMGVGGRTTVESRILGVNSTSKEDIKFNDDDPSTSGQEGASYDRLKRFDFGANFGAGVDIGPVILKANYGLGLAKINSTDADNDDNDKNKYRTLSISVGIPLGR